MLRPRYIYLFVISFFVVISSTGALSAQFRTVTDSAQREVTIPRTVDRIICSGAGCLRLVTYLGAQNLVLAVDDIEKRKRRFDARPYALANPRFKKLPVFGEFRGHDDPEKILGLDPLPQVIFKTYPSMGYDPQELQEKTGIPVITLNYGNLGKHRKALYRSLTIMGTILGKEKRSKEVIRFFEDEIQTLDGLCKASASLNQRRCYVGGIAFKGPHGFSSTEPSYPPFVFVHAQNLAAAGGFAGRNMMHSQVSKEKILEWDPEILFLDLSTLQMGDHAGGLYELRTDPVYQSLSALKREQVFGVLPYNWYSQNFGSILANAWFIAKVIYPDRFSDIDPAAKADDIYEFLVGKPVFGQMNTYFQSMVFKPVPMQEN